MNRNSLEKHYGVANGKFNFDSQCVKDRSVI